MSVPTDEIEKSIEKFYFLLEMENEQLRNSISLTTDEFHFCWLWNYVILESFPSKEKSLVPEFTYIHGQTAKFYWLCILSILRGQTVQFGHMFRQFTECARYAAFAITWPSDPRLESYGKTKNDKATMFAELQAFYPDEISEIKRITDHIQPFTHPSILQTSLNKIYSEETNVSEITFTDKLPNETLKIILKLLGVYGGKYVSILLKSPNKNEIKYDKYITNLLQNFLIPQSNNYIDDFIK